jgi:hypothetical protein
MSNLIRANRLEVSDRFPVLGFTIRTDSAPTYCEIAVAASDALFRPDQKAQRNANNFYSTRASGPIKVERGETVYLLPADVLSRFVGQEKLYYGLAIFPDPARSTAEISVMPTASSPWINIKMLTGRSLRRTNNAGRNGYGNVDALVWAGDAVRPGVEVVGATPPASNGNNQSAPSVSPPNLTNGTNPAAGPTVAVQSSYDSRFDTAYDDGFDQSLWSRMHATEESSDDSGIEEPIPDVSPASVGQALAYGRAMAAPQYPGSSRFVPAALVNYRSPSSPRSISRVVIHITDGGRNIAGPISWFENPNQINSRGETIHVSAHYVIGQDGEVVQMVNHEDIAWHAGRANGDSIGIEHVANTQGLVPTEAEYCASAGLVRWLCDQYGIPVDRDHIQGHAEADTRTTHKSCPNAVWDWEYFMGMVTSGACAPREVAAAQSWRGAGSLAHTNGHARSSQRRATALSAEILYTVPLIPQPDKLSCWAASMAMLLSFRRGETVSPERLAQEVGRSLRTSYSWDMLEAVKDQFGFHEIDLPSNATLYPLPEQWFQWLNDYGPLWVTVRGAPSHAIIVHGISGDLTPSGTTIHVLNPWDTTAAFSGDQVDFDPLNNGRAYAQPFEAFAADFGLINLPLGNWRVLCLPAPSAQSAGWSRSVRAASTISHVRALDNASFDIHWSETQLVPQLTDKSCWAAAATMVIGWRDRISINPSEIAKGTGYWEAYKNGLYPNNHRDLAQAWGLIMEPPQSYSVEGFRQLLEYNGPLWIGVAVPGGHAVVVTGMYGDGTLENTFVRINDPWPPDQGKQTVQLFTQLMQEYENRITTDSSGNVNVQIMHAGGRNATSQSQSYRPARAQGHLPRRSQSMAVVEIASSIAGAAMTRILEDRGDVAWELDQLRGLKHIGDNAANAGASAYQDAKPVTISGWYFENRIGDRITADFRVRFQYNGRSVGNVQVDNVGTNDAVGWGLHVRANIMDDAQVYTTTPPSDARFAAVRVHFYYRFDRLVGGDYIAEIDLTLFGNGTHTKNGRWVQEG